VLCYTQDVLASLKEHYAAMNKQREYNVPMIIKVADSLGNVCQATELRRDSASYASCRFYIKSSGRLYPGDRLTIEVEVDPTFERSSYRLEWFWRGNKPAQLNDVERVVIDIDNSHVEETFGIQCKVISNRDWHRLGDHDDIVLVMYKVLPPPS
jgi:hypothetical protein